MYIEVAGSGDFKRLIKQGKATDSECLEAWESIVKKQEKENGVNTYGSFLQLLKGYASLLNDHTVIRACLLHLMFAPVDWEVMQTLNSKGYSIEVDERGRAEYKSLQAGLRRCENLITKATMKHKELERMFQGREKGEAQSFESIMAALNFAWPNTVPDDITLKKYNEYQKILKANQKKAEEHGRDKRK